MTIIEVYEDLFIWFKKNDSITFNKKNPAKDDFLKIVKVSDNEDLHREVLNCALQEFEKAGYVKKTETKDCIYWILTKPLESYSQNVDLDFDTCGNIAAVINGFCEKIGNKIDICDPLSVKCKDIKNLLLILIHVNGKDEQETK